MDGKNFRSSYLEKVGITNIVDEKKTLDVLLSDYPIKLQKLKKYCLEDSVPTMHRFYIWKLLLDIYPCFHDNLNFVNKVHFDHYNELKHTTVLIMGFSNSTLPQDLHLAMYLLNQGLLPCSGINNSDEMCISFKSLNMMLLEIFDDMEDVFWLSLRIHNKMLLEIPSQRIEIFKKDIDILLLKEDKDGRLRNHLNQLQFYENFPLRLWCYSALSQLKLLSLFERIGDKLFAGGINVIKYVIVSLILTSKVNILKSTSTAELLNLYDNIPEESGALIANKALEMWHQQLVS